MRYFTRFTDEIFAALISLIFIYEAIHAIIHIFNDLEEASHHATALLSLLLALGTFYIAKIPVDVPYQSLFAAQDPRVSGRFRSGYRVGGHDCGGGAIP